MKRSGYIFIGMLLMLVQVGLAALGNGTHQNAPSSFQYLDHLPRSTRFTPHTVIVKFKSQHKYALKKNSVDILSLSPTFLRFGVTRTIQMYPNSEPMYGLNGEIDITRMYRIGFTSDDNPLDVAKEFSRLPEVEYADPEVIYDLCMTPNDPLFSQQCGLQSIQAAKAWDITTGDPKVVIAIVDTGVYWQHEDLKDNIWVNPGEDINHNGRYDAGDDNGIDDDGDGYIDNIIGIDFVGKDALQGGSYYDSEPSPKLTGNPHGTHVAGIAAAVGNNGRGITGVAFTCKILAVKCASDQGENSIARGYDGIVYAADRGASIINCSWGGGGYLRSEEDRIQYAVSKGALVVAAAGNSGMQQDFSSPASYPLVLSVANVDCQDKKSGSSTYGTWDDVSAPGENILSTIPPNNYAAWSGTSMASPCAAGVAALVKSKFPSYTPLQVAEQVRVTSDNIDAKNPAYAQKIGFGRVNAYRALTVSSPSVRMVKYTVSDAMYGNGNGIIDPGEKLEVTVDWKNYLAPTNNALASLSLKTTYATVTKGSFTIGQLGTGQTITNASDPFIVEVKPNVPLNYKIDFNYNILDGIYQDYGGFTVFARPTYREHDRNDILMTISNDGNLGFDDFTGLRGKGFIYQNNGFNVMFEGSFMVGGKINDTIHVVDQARDETGSVQNSDFTGDNSVSIETPGKIADQEGFASWTDNSAPLVSRLGIKVDLHSYEFIKPEAKNIVILRYKITNTSKNFIKDLHAGLFFDWDVGTDAYNDSAKYDDTHKVGLAFDISQVNGVPTHAGVTPLTRDTPIHFVAINNPDKGLTPNFGIHDGFTKNEKWISLSSGILKKYSYVTDVSMVMANGPYQLQPGDSCEVAFALLAGLNNYELFAAADNAVKIWDSIKNPTSVETTLPIGLFLEQNYPNPFSSGLHGNAMTSIQYTLPSTGLVRLEILDAYGRALSTLVNQHQSLGTYTVSFLADQLPSGIYFAKLTFGNTTVMRKMVYLH